MTTCCAKKDNIKIEESNTGLERNLIREIIRGDGLEKNQTSLYNNEEPESRTELGSRMPNNFEDYYYYYHTDENYTDSTCYRCKRIGHYATYCFVKISP